MWQGSDKCLVRSWDILWFSGNPPRERAPLLSFTRGLESEEFCPFVTANIFSISDYKQNIQLDNVRTITSGALWTLWSGKVHSAQQNAGTIQGPVWVQRVPHHQAILTLINQNGKNLASQVSPAWRGGWESLQFRDKNCDGGCDR